MIVTLVPNPSLDRTVVIPGFSAGQLYRPAQVLTLAGGKGFNFARALRTLGRQCLLLAPVGGHTGQLLLELAQQEGLICEHIALASELRTCLTIVDPAADYRLTEVYEQGAPLEADAWERLLARTAHHLAQASLLAVCGSFPPGTPRSALRNFISQANATTTPVFLDTHGGQLAEALAAGPALLKINQFEAGELVGRNLDTPLQALAGAEELQRRGAKAVVITLGKQGAVGLTDEGQAFAWAAPEVVALSSTGSGDALFAGIVAGLEQGWTLPASARLGIAAGAANTLQIGAGQFTFAQVQSLLASIQPLALPDVSSHDIEMEE